MQGTVVLLFFQNEKRERILDISKFCLFDALIASASFSADMVFLIT